MFPHFISLSLFIPLLLFFNIFTHIVSADTLERRLTLADPGRVNKQVDALFEILHSQYGSEIQTRSALSKRQVSRQLHVALKKEKDEKLRILFVQFGGSGGDIGKSQSYLNYMKNEASYQDKIAQEAGLWRQIAQAFGGKKSTQYDLQLVIDCEYKKYLTEPTLAEWKADIDRCGETRIDFQNAIKLQMREFKPHVVIQGNALSKPYSPLKTGRDQYLEELMEPIQARVKLDTLVVINVKANYKRPYEINDPSRPDRRARYVLNQNDIHIIGQTADYFPDEMPADSWQTRIGRAPTAAMDAPPAALLQWVRKQKKVMYLGHGGRLRSREATLDSPTPVVQQFVEKRLNEPKSKDWSFIIFHNYKRAESDRASPITHNGRVYHMWFGSALLPLWEHPKIQIVMHHCGKGSFDDTILAGAAQICMPQNGFAHDMFDWSGEVNRLGLGVGLLEPEAITFEGGAKASDADYKGVQEPYSEAAVAAFDKAWATVSKNPKKYQSSTTQRKAALRNPTAGPLTVEIVNRMALGVLRRKQSPRPTPPDSDQGTPPKGSPQRSPERGGTEGGKGGKKGD
ncbi:MAG: hypothetical protein M1822_001127 [Bathelium mastoideum]|nr:MAG: hypothetical protein M1822_001127 [Bathelium mastoideum]